VKDSKFEIAFKRSNLDSSLSKVRIVFYVNNKSAVNLSVDFQYKFEKRLFSLSVTEKLRYVDAHQQSREAVEV
jgi:hypothetical protein